MKRQHLFDALLGATAGEQPRSRSRWIIWLSLVLAAVFLYLALKDLDWGSFWVTLRGAQYGLLPVVLVWSSLSYLTRALRWRVLLVAEKPISKQSAFWANMSGYLGNNILPVRMGELARAAYANRIASISLSFALACGFSERLVDAFVLILLGAVSFSIIGISSGIIQQTIHVMVVVAGIGAVLFFLLPFLGPLFGKIIHSAPFFPQNLKEGLTSFIDKFMLGLRALLHPGRALVFVMYTALIWLMDGFNVVLMGYMLKISINMPQAFVLLAGLGLSSAIPSTPGYVGVYQFVAVAVLGIFGIESAAALALILFAQVANWLVVGSWGLISLANLTHHISNHELSSHE